MTETSSPDHGGDHYQAHVGGGVGGHFIAGSHVNVTTIYQAPVPWKPSAGSIRRVERRPERVVGRDELLAEVRAQLTAGPGVSVVAMCGLGGVGKTTTAVEYSHRHLDDYALIWHAHAETMTGLLADFHDLAVALGVDLGGDVVAAVHAGLGARESPWLLVLDNVADHGAARRLLPTAGTGHVVVTSQDGTWPERQRIDVPTLGLDAAIAFLLDAAGTTDRPAAARLAIALGLLPLALTQAAAYVRNSGLTLADYLDLLDAQPVKVLDRSAPAAHADSVKATWNVALTELAESSPGSVTLQRLLAFTASEDIPFWLILDHRKPLPDDVDRQVAAEITALRVDRLTIGDAMAGLRRHSLVGPPSETVTVHRLVQTITRHHLAADDREQWRAATAALLAAAIPADVTVRSAWPTFALLLPHVLAACDSTSAPIRQMANYLSSAGEYATARTIWITVHDARTDQPDYGPEHPDTLTARSLVIELTGKAGDPVAARDMCRAFLPVRERVLGPEHPDTLTTRANLADWTGEAGDAAAARDLNQALLPVCERVSGPEHPASLYIRNNAAYWTGVAGDAIGAREQFRALLPVMERVFGSEHPTTLIARANLADRIGEAGNAIGARDMFRKLLPVRERVSGPEHPDTLYIRNNLAQWTGMAGDTVGARDMLRALLPLRERVLGPEHPLTLTTLDNLAQWTGVAGDAVGAREMLRALLPVRERVLGSEHPLTLITRDNLDDWTERART